MSTQTKAAALTPEIEALAEYLKLRDELIHLEEVGEDQCSCDPDNFHTCDFCRESQDKLHRSRRLLDLWGDSWAVLLQNLTALPVNPLPFQVWCDCGHISGQHAAKYPYKCAVANGCEKECYGFRSSLYAAAQDLLKAAKLTILHFERSQVSGNFQGDDEHEAWTALEAAVRKANGPAPEAKP